MSSRRLFGAIIGVGAVAIVAFLALAWRPALAPVEPPAPQSFAPDLVAQGRILASAGNCVTCHTADGGKPFAGGFPIPTPFGTVFSTNITPDRDSGIGTWSLPAFTRAMREGVSRDGKHLFPAFPYDHFAKLTDGDVGALYAYLMTVPAVAATPPANTVPFPLDVRALQAGWKMLFFRSEPYRPDAARSAEWNRGAYLAEGLAHCGACHTPRNVLGAESVGHPYNGAIVDREWVAWPLDVSVSPARWTRDDFVTYLTGGTTVHGRAHGPMGPVVRGLKALPDADIAAIADYFASLNRPQSSKADALVRQVLARSRAIATDVREPGRQLYLAACAGCHDDGGTTPLATRAVLSLNTALWYDRPNNFVLTVLNGVGTSDDAPGPLMPPFRDALTDTEIVAIAGYLRGVRLHLPNWPASEYNKVDRLRDHPLADDVVKIRKLPAE